MRARWIFVVAAIVVVAGVWIAITRGSSPLPQPEGCTATVANHRVDLSLAQGRNAALISAIAVRRGMPARAASIALATAYQESKLQNLSHGDRDSLGLFQQRPSQGWGTAAQVRDPYYAINAFYDALAKINGYEHMRITVAAQEVQRSGYPEAYQQHAADARALASALTGFSPARFHCVVHASDDRGTAQAVQASLTKTYGRLDAARTGSRQDLEVRLAASVTGRQQGWSIAQYLVAYAKPLHVRRVAFDGRVWRAGSASENGWTKGSATSTRVAVGMG